ncbi:MAG TPA: hypothetical protein VHA06_10140 [Candidatus Angelobacter sp.]|jgi:hypothetical protein|nr:hypothetical protein [Candidatus Angelobacter sp.]
MRRRDFFQGVAALIGGCAATPLAALISRDVRKVYWKGTNLQRGLLVDGKMVESQMNQALGCISAIVENPELVRHLAGQGLRVDYVALKSALAKAISRSGDSASV